MARAATLLKNVCILVLDFDGVQTDGFAYVFEDGREAVRVSRKDGLGISMLMKAGVRVVILSREKNPVVEARAKKLGVECFQGIDEKAVILANVLKKYNIQPEHAAYMGDDIIDIEPMGMVGVAIAPLDAHPKVHAAVDIIVSRKGGDHAVREACDIILNSKQKG